MTVEATRQKCNDDFIHKDVHLLNNNYTLTQYHVITGNDVIVLQNGRVVVQTLQTDTQPCMSQPCTGLLSIGNNLPVDFLVSLVREYCDGRVCLHVVCVYVREHISETTHPIFAIFLCVLTTVCCERKDVLY